MNVRHDTANLLHEIEQLKASIKKGLDERTAALIESSVQVERGLTVRQWGETWLSRREREGIRGAKRDDRPTWRVHVLSEPWADRELASITRAEARDWWSRLHSKTISNPRWKAAARAKPLSAARLENILLVARKAFADAEEDELITSNPFDRLRVHRSRKATTTLDVDHVLRPEEQLAAFRVLTRTERLLAGIAMGTRMRRGEQCGLRLADVNVTSSRPMINVRFGTGGKGSTKGGRARRVALTGLALYCMREWLELLPTLFPYNPNGLVFPRNDGKERRGRPFKMERICAVIGRSFRWHDWRHTGATSVASGWWGDDPWPLEVLRVDLGHSSVNVTERYAKLAGELALDVAFGSVADRRCAGRELRDQLIALCGPDVDDVQPDLRNPGLRKCQEGTENMTDPKMGEAPELEATGAYHVTSSQNPNGGRSGDLTHSQEGSGPAVDVYLRPRAEVNGRAPLPHEPEGAAAGSAVEVGALPSRAPGVGGGDGAAARDGVADVEVGAVRLIGGAHGGVQRLREATTSEASADDRARVSTSEDEDATSLTDALSGVSSGSADVDQDVAVDDAALKRGTYPQCPASFAGYPCTLRLGHDGDHGYESDGFGAIAWREKRGEHPQHASLLGFVTWIAKHPDVGDSLTAVEREKRFQSEARKVLAGNAPGWEKRVERQESQQVGPDLCAGCPYNDPFEAKRVERPQPTFFQVKRTWKVGSRIRLKDNWREEHEIPDGFPSEGVIERHDEETDLYTLRCQGWLVSSVEADAFDVLGGPPLKTIGEMRVEPPQVDADGVPVEWLDGGRIGGATFIREQCTRILEERDAARAERDALREDLETTFDELCRLEGRPLVPDPLSASGARALSEILLKIGSWTSSRWDQWLRHEIPDDVAYDTIAWLGRNIGWEVVPEHLRERLKEKRGATPDAAATGEPFGTVPLGPTTTVHAEVEAIRKEHVEQVARLTTALKETEKMRAEAQLSKEQLASALDEALKEVAKLSFVPTARGVYQPVVKVTDTDVSIEDLMVARAAHMSLMTRILLPSVGGQRAEQIHRELAKFFATHRLGSTNELATRYRAAVGLVSDLHTAMAGSAAVLDAYAKQGGRR